MVHEALVAEPVDGSDNTSAWLTAQPHVVPALRKMYGRSEYVGRKGVYVSANGVFWVEPVGERPGGRVIVANVPESGRTKVEATQAAIEGELLFPLLRGRDVSRWSAKPELSIILTHKEGRRLKAISENEMQHDYPRTWAYLVRYREILLKSGLYRRFCKDSDPFYSMFDIGDYTFAKWKLVIREIARSLTCAVVGSIDDKPIIPDHKLILVGTEDAHEAHYLCALLNSSLSRLFVGSYCIETQFSSHILSFLRVPRFNARKKSHRRLARLSCEAHVAAQKEKQKKLDRIEQKISRVAARVWAISNDEVAEVQRSSTVK